MARLQVDRHGAFPDAGPLSVGGRFRAIYPLLAKHVNCHVCHVAGVIDATVVSAFPFQP